MATGEASERSLDDRVVHGLQPAAQSRGVARHADLARPEVLFAEELVGWVDASQSVQLSGGGEIGRAHV